MTILKVETFCRDALILRKFFLRKVFQVQASLVTFDWREGKREKESKKTLEPGLFDPKMAVSLSSLSQKHFEGFIFILMRDG